MLPDVGEDLGVGERERVFIGALRIRREFWESNEGFGVDHTVNARKNPRNHVCTCSDPYIGRVFRVGRSRFGLGG